MRTVIPFVLAVLCFLTDVSDGCDTFQVSGANILNTQLDTAVHVPLATSQCATLRRCIQDGFHVATCNKINYAPGTGTCHFFNITGPETIVASPIVTWKAVDISVVTWTPSEYSCTPNTCSAGESCFVVGNSPICTRVN